MVLKTLMAQKEKVEQTLGQMKVNHNDNKDALFGDDSVEEADRAGKEISAHTYYSLMNRKSEELLRLEALIKNILEDEEFGYCEQCGEEINYKRLVAMPGVTTCIDCQRELEKGLGTRRDIDKKIYTAKHGFDMDLDDSSENFQSTAMKQKVGFLSWDDLQGMEMEDLDLIQSNSFQSSPNA